MQGPVGDPPQFHADRAAWPPCADDQEVCCGRPLREHLACGVFECGAAEPYLWMFPGCGFHGIVEERFRRPLVVAGGVAGHDHVVDRFVW